MSQTRKLIEGLSATQVATLENRKDVLALTEKRDVVKGEIRGYLAGLKDCGVITESGFRVLYNYYTMV